MNKATIEIKKSFDSTKSYSKYLDSNDLYEFFKDEGKYLDNLAETLETKGNQNDSFEVIYKVNIIKE